MAYIEPNNTQEKDLVSSSKIAPHQVPSTSASGSKSATSSCPVKTHALTRKDGGGFDRQRESSVGPVDIPKWKNVRRIIVHALLGGARSYLIAFGLRSGITFVLRVLFRVIRGKDTLYNAILGLFSDESLRFANMVGSFSFLWKLINNLLFHFRKKQSKINGAIAGSIAGLSVLFENHENRVSIAQQMFVRSMQAGYNMLKARKLFSFAHGDALLFALACASIQYAYIMQPATIPREYYSWMVKTARVPEPSLQLNRENLRAWERFEQSGVQPTMDLGHVENVLRAGSACPEAYAVVTEALGKHDGVLPIAPCAVIHPKDIQCSRYTPRLFATVFWNMVPVYAALNGVPLLVLKFPSFIKKPWFYIQRVLFNTARSSTFLGAYIALFQTLTCSVRNLLPDSPDNKFYYYFIGLISSGLTIFIEDKSRRGDLALYTIPKGLQSLHTVLNRRGRMVSLPGIEILATSLSMGILMSVYQVEPHRISSLLYKVMRNVIGTY